MMVPGVSLWLVKNIKSGLLTHMKISMNSDYFLFQYVSIQLMDNAAQYFHDKLLNPY